MTLQGAAHTLPQGAIRQNCFVGLFTEVNSKDLC